MSVTFSLSFGALAPPISEQLETQGLTSPGSLFQRQADAIVLLHVHGVLTDTSAHAARKRLLKAITNALKSARKK